MASYAYALVLVGLINLIFAFYTWQSSKTSQSVRFFALSIACVGFWGLGLAGFLSTKDSNIALLWAKFHYVASIYVAYFLLLFILAITRKGKVKLSNQFLLQIPILLVSIITVFFDQYLLQDVIIQSKGNIAILYRPGHLIYGLIFVIYYMTTLYLNIIGIVKNRNVARKQLALIFAGLVLAGILGGIFNLILPILGNYELIWVGPQFTIIFLGLTFVGILKYQLFNIRLLVGKITYVSLSSILLYIAFVFLFKLNTRLFDNILDWDAILFGIFVAIGFAVTYDKIRGIIEENINSRIINPGFDPTKYIKLYNNKLGRTKDQETLLKELHEVIKQTINPIYFSIMVKYENHIINKQYSGNMVFEYEEIFNFLRNPKNAPDGYLALNTLVGSFQTQQSLRTPELTKIMLLLERYSIQLVIPIFSDKELISVMVLGKRDLNNSTYIESEIDFLKSLSSVTGVSLVKSQLYEEVQKFNMSLQSKVNEQTKELQTKVKELEEARRKENDMIDIMGHELRTPATIVKLNASFLHKFTEEIDSNPEGYKKYVKRIQDAIENEIKLINTLLSSAKLEGDKIELNPEEIDIKCEIEMSLHGQEDMAKEKGLKIINQTDKNTPNVYADKARLVEVLNNLVSNAVKYTDKGGVLIKTAFNREFVKVSVIDTGNGISKEDLPKLGQKFYRTSTYIKSSQSDNTDIVRPGGTGLGLYVTFNLVKKMGGDIWVESEVGKGSVFSFTIPIYTSQISNKTNSSTNMFERLGLKG